MYAIKDQGPGPELMGADTLMGTDVVHKDGEELGEITAFTIDMASGRMA